MRRVVLPLVLGLVASAALAQEAENGSPGILRTAPQPASPATEALLEKMRNAYKNIKSARVSVDFERRGKGTKVNMKSECSFLAPSSVRATATGLERLPASGYLLVTDGKKIHLEGLAGGPVTKNYRLRDMVMDMPQVNLEVLCLWDWGRQLSRTRGGGFRGSALSVHDEDWNGKTYTVLEETIRRQSIRILYFTDPASGLIWHVEVFDLEAKVPFIVTSITKLELNVPIDKSLFTIK